MPAGRHRGAAGELGDGRTVLIGHHDAGRGVVAEEQLIFGACGARNTSRVGDLRLRTVGAKAALWYSCMSPPRTCLRADRVLGEVDRFGWL